MRKWGRKRRVKHILSSDYPLHDYIRTTKQFNEAEFLKVCEKNGLILREHLFATNSEQQTLLMTAITCTNYGAVVFLLREIYEKNNMQVNFEKTNIYGRNIKELIKEANSIEIKREFEKFVTKYHSKFKHEINLLISLAKGKKQLDETLVLETLSTLKSHNKGISEVLLAAVSHVNIRMVDLLLGFIVKHDIVIDLSMKNNKDRDLLECTQRCCNLDIQQGIFRVFGEKFDRESEYSKTVLARVRRKEESLEVYLRSIINLLKLNFHIPVGKKGFLVSFSLELYCYKLEQNIFTEAELKLIDDVFDIIERKSLERTGNYSLFSEMSESGESLSQYLVFLNLPTVLSRLLTFANNRSKELLNVLLEKPDLTGSTALHWCALIPNHIESRENIEHEDRIQCCKVLLDNGANIDATFKTGIFTVNAFILAAMVDRPVRKKQIGLMNFLLTKGINLDLEVQKGVLLVQQLLFSGLIEIVIELLKRDQLDISHPTFMNDFLYGCFRRFVVLKQMVENELELKHEVLELLKQRCLANKNWSVDLDLLTKRTANYNVFFDIIKYNDVIILDWFLKTLKQHNSALLNKLLVERDVGNLIPIHLCFHPDCHIEKTALAFEGLFKKSCSRLNILKRLMPFKHQFDETIEVAGMKTKSIFILYLLAVDVQPEIGKFVVDNFAIDFTTNDTGDNTLLSFIVTQGEIEIFEYVLERGLVTVKDILEAGSFLIAFVLKVNEKSINHSLPSKTKLNCLNLIEKLLLKDNIDMSLLFTSDVDNNNIVHACAQCCDNDTFEWVVEVLKKKNKPFLEKLVNSRNSNGNATPFLVLAARASAFNQNSRRLLKGLLDCGADINVMTPMGITFGTHVFRSEGNVMLLAVIRNKISLVEFLIENKIEVFGPEDYYCEDAALYCGNFEILKMLIIHGYCERINPGFTADNKNFLTNFVYRFMECVALCLVRLKKKFDQNLLIDILDICYEKLEADNRLDELFLLEWEMSFFHVAVRYNHPSFIFWLTKKLKARKMKKQLQLLCKSRSSVVAKSTAFLSCAIPTGLFESWEEIEQNDRVECAKALLEAGSKLNDYVVNNNKEKLNAFVLTIGNEGRSESQVKLRNYLHSQKINIDYQVVKGVDVFAVAMTNKSFEAMELLMKSGKGRDTTENDNGDINVDFIEQLFDKGSFCKHIRKDVLPTEPAVIRILEYLLDMCFKKKVYEMDSLFRNSISNLNMIHWCVIHNLPQILTWAVKALQERGEGEYLSKLIYANHEHYGTPWMLLAVSDLHFESDAQIDPTSRMEVARFLLNQGVDVNECFYTDEGEACNVIVTLISTDHPTLQTFELMKFFIDNGVVVDESQRDGLIYEVISQGSDVGLEALLVKLYDDEGDSFFNVAIAWMLDKVAQNSTCTGGLDPMLCLRQMTTVFFKKGYRPIAKDFNGILLWRKSGAGYKYLNWCLDQFAWQEIETIGDLLTVTVVSKVFSAYLMLRDKGMQQAQNSYMHICQNKPAHRHISIATEEEHDCFGIEFSNSRVCDFCAGNINGTKYQRCTGKCDFDVCENCMYCYGTKGETAFGAKELAKRKRLIKFSNCIIFQEKLQHGSKPSLMKSNEMLILMNAGIDSSALVSVLTKTQSNLLGLNSST